MSANTKIILIAVAMAFVGAAVGFISVGVMNFLHETLCWSWLQLHDGMSWWEKLPAALVYNGMLIVHFKTWGRNFIESSVKLMIDFMPPAPPACLPITADLIAECQRVNDLLRSNN